ncbi:MAG: TIGR03857 family LLM class F420-dependent oxidoreductase [Steroidobacteraceae bacterium]
MSTRFFPELGFYTLPGHVFDPRPALREIDDADRLGLGSVWISERLNTKDIGVLTGAAIVRSERIGVASGLMNNLPLRNAMVVASYAATSMMLSNNRFTLGIGRGTDSLEDRLGIPHASDQLVEDYVDILRRLWRGEVVTYDGPAGRFNGATLGLKLGVPPPVVLGAVGFKNCEWAGRFCDGVLFNTFWTAEATAEGVRRVRASAEAAGRDPAKIKIWAILAAACEVSEEIELTTIVRRLNTYLFFPRQWNATLRVNRWDPAVAERLRAALKEIDRGRSSAGTIGDESTSRDLEDIRRMRELWPREWIDTSTATGSAAHCVKCVRDRFDAGVDGVAFHASTPANLSSLLAAWDKVRPSDAFAGRVANPGL